MLAELTRADALFAELEVEQGMEILSDLLDAHHADPKARDQLLAWATARVGHDHPQIGAHIALAGGALIEAGASPTALGRALIAPVERALVDARRMLVHAAEHGHRHGQGDDLHDDELAPDDEADEADDAEHDHDDAHDHDHDHDVEVAGYFLSHEAMETIAGKDLAAVRAWFSLEMWYRPAVAAWTRDLAVLAEVQQRSTLREALAATQRETESSHWLSILVQTVAAAPFVVVIPELSEAWSFTADGVVELGQLTVLLSHALAAPIARVGGSAPATADQLAVMQGVGPQSRDGGYASSFAFYPVEASDPTTGMPRDGVHTWSAPGGTGSHSLPADFLPGTIAPIEGARVLVMVGPNAPGTRFVRIIQASRMFDALSASITEVRQLPADEARRWQERARARGQEGNAGGN